ncbi:MAG: hypothetical protein U5R06_16450 [candidate division KSB1 bacterium]|nr:hypothetical protein [candidate division KSB1 bacterium]
MIQVKTINNNEFQVTIQENSSQSKHTVHLNDDVYQRLTNEKIARDELIRLSFEFLLNREPKESILSEFNLTLISTYFPDYEQDIRKTIAEI